MAQLLQKQINTVAYTNAVLRSSGELGQLVTLRTDGINYPEFARLSILKDLVLDLGRQVSAESILDVVVAIVKPGETINLNAYENRLILALENASNFAHADNRFTPDTGDLIWTNEPLQIANTSSSISILLIVDFKEFLL